jgi:hypothetical protein
MKPKKIVAKDQRIGKRLTLTEPRISELFIGGTVGLLEMAFKMKMPSSVTSALFGVLKAGVNQAPLEALLTVYDKLGGKIDARLDADLRAMSKRKVPKGDYSDLTPLAALHAGAAGVEFNGRGKKRRRRRTK